MWIPAEVHAEIERLARQEGTTTNDVDPARRGAVDACRRRERIAEVAWQRRAAAARVVSADAVEDFPSPDELRAAMLFGRAAS